MNIAELFNQQAELFPHKRAIVVSHIDPRVKKSLPEAGRVSYTHLTFAQLKISSDQFAEKLLKLGLQKGSKVLLFLKPSLDFPIVTLALFKIGAIPIFMDPGMGRKNLLRSMKQIRPEALISVPIILNLRRFFPGSFASMKVFISAGNWGRGEIASEKKKSHLGYFFQRYSLPKLLQAGHLGPLPEATTPTHTPSLFHVQQMQADETAAILFTSGGTGIPKGVIYTHEIFSQQVKMLGAAFDLKPADVDLPGFPLFSLFTMSMGMTSCVPPMDPSQPAKCDPAKLVKTILDQGITFAAGSPAIWERVADYCLRENIELSSIRQVVMFGAPVPLSLHQKWQKILPNGTTYTPYGATECLPLSNISGRELLDEETSSQTLAGHGTCVGKPLPGLQVKIMKMREDAINEEVDLIEQVGLCPQGEIGEIIVTGAVTTKVYADMLEETRKAKIVQKLNNNGESKQIIWHRMGDVGFFDEAGRLWFCGRKVHRVETAKEILFSEPCELIFNHHPLVKRSALIGLGKKGKQIPSIVIEVIKQGSQQEQQQQQQHKQLQKSEVNQLSQELFALAAKHPQTRDVRKIFYAENFPVDIRHNIKIDRLKLKEQAERGKLQKGGERS